MQQLRGRIIQRRLSVKQKQQQNNAGMGKEKNIRPA